jgi:LuxR family maltose regulon positive regulatory protein
MSDVTVVTRRVVRARAARIAPRLRAGVLRRERLVRRLEQAAEIPVLLLVAPAGYGKTTLLAQWVQRDRRPAGWIAFTAGDDDAGRVLVAIAEALERLGAGDDVAPSIPSVVRAMERLDRPFLLVLDDVHHLRSPQALATLRALAELVPEGAQLALASRCEPALQVGRLRGQGRLVDVRARDLAMTRREATALLSLAGLDLPPDDVQMLMDRTEGWPAALYLAALALRGRPDLPRAVARFAGDDRIASDYLRDEVLSGLDPGALELLRSASILDVLTGPACDALLGALGAGDMLRSLSRSNALVAPVDSTDAAFRCHPMLASMLRAELRRSDPERAAELHRRASGWYEAEHDLDRAVAHAIDAGDVERAGRLMWSAAGAHVLDGRRAVVRRWLDRLDDGRVAAHPALALTAAACHLAAGERDLVEHWAAAAARGLGAESEPSLHAGVAVMRAAVARDGVAAMDADAARAYAGAAEDSPWRAVCCLLRGVAAHLRGDRDAAQVQLEEGSRRGAIAAPSVQVLCLAQLALMAIERSDWEQAPLLASRAMAQVERRELGGDPLCALVFAVSALVRAHRDRVERAQGDRRRATALLTALVDHVPWFEIETRVALARSALRLGDVTGARTVLAEATRLLPKAPDTVVLHAWVEELWAQLEAFAATALVGPSSLTTAELRVLALLPTHLSFREMGRRLHVSGNTIKTHAHAVYRKLDVCSRSEAVVRAGEMGLLGVGTGGPTTAS